MSKNKRRFEKVIFIWERFQWMFPIVVSDLFSCTEVTPCLRFATATTRLICTRGGHLLMPSIWWVQTNLLCEATLDSMEEYLQKIVGLVMAQCLTSVRRNTTGLFRQNWNGTGLNQYYAKPLTLQWEWNRNWELMHIEIVQDSISSLVRSPGKFQNGWETHSLSPQSQSQSHSSYRVKW